MADDQTTTGSPSATDLLDVPATALREPLLREHSLLLTISRGDARLARSDRGEAVRRVQEALSRLGLVHRGRPGDFDRETATALKRFQRGHGLRGTGILDAKTLLELDEALRRRGQGPGDADALERLDHRSPEYARAVAQWPDERPIWPALSTSRARLQFIRHCLARDETNEMPYDGHFTNLCTGFAAQVYARLSARAELDARIRANLRGAPSVDSGHLPAKLRLPLLMVSSRGHMFNAVQVGGAADKISSYLFIEPQKDQVIVPGDPFWKRYVELHGISLVDLVDCDESGVITTRHVQGFLLGGAGEMLPVSNERTTAFGKDLAIAESDPKEYAFMVGQGGFAAFVHRRAHEQWCLGEAELIEVGRIVRGRRIREHRDLVATPVTPERYGGWVGRPDLIAALRA